MGPSAQLNPWNRLAAFPGSFRLPRFLPPTSGPFPSAPRRWEQKRRARIVTTIAVHGSLGSANSITGCCSLPGSLQAPVLSSLVSLPLLPLHKLLCPILCATPPALVVNPLDLLVLRVPQQALLVVRTLATLRGNHLLVVISVLSYSNYYVRDKRKIRGNHLMHFPCCRCKTLDPSNQFYMKFNER